MRSPIRLRVIIGFTFILLAGQAGFSGGADMSGWEVPKQSSDTIVIPVSEKELMDLARQALFAGGAVSASVKKIELNEYGTIYEAKTVNTGLPVFARFVARRVPCGDCHDVFFLYTFDGSRFLGFIPVLITKLYNKKWDEKDISKIESRFVGKPFQDRVPFNPFVDTITSATMSAKIVFHSMNETQSVYEKLTETGNGQ
jgi:hypothetical protein